jgi:hypothetical protein
MHQPKINSSLLKPVVAEVAVVTSLKRINWHVILQEIGIILFPAQYMMHKTNSIFFKYNYPTTTKEHL